MASIRESGLRENMNRALAQLDANHATAKVAAELIASRFAPYTADPLRQIKHG
jgi:hypothetical protein